MISVERNYFSLSVSFDVDKNSTPYATSAHTRFSATTNFSSSYQPFKCQTNQRESAKRCVVCGVERTVATKSNPFATTAILDFVFLFFCTISISPISALCARTFTIKHN